MRNRHGDIMPYQLRHTFAQTASDTAEVPVEVLARLMGYRTYDRGDWI